MQRTTTALFTSLLLTTLLLVLNVSQANAGCKLNLTIKNSTGSTIEVIKHRVKVKGGTWAKIVVQKKKLKNGEKVLHTWNAMFKCSANRRYEFQYRIKNSSNPGNLYTTRYYPNASGWTKKQNFIWSIK